jgi:hypothetical protein
MTVSIFPPYPIFTDRDGQPLDGGQIFIGTANLDPIVNPIAVFFDAAMTISAPQPLTTLGGYIVDGSGIASNIYCATDFSILIRSRQGISLVSAPSYGFRIFSDAITFNTLVINTSILPDTAGGALNGTNAKSWTRVTSRDVHTKELSVFSQTQPTVAGDLNKLTQLMMPLLAVNQTSITTTAAFVNLYNMDSGATVRTTTGAYTVVPLVALPSVNVAVKVASMDNAGLGFRSVMARVVSVNEIAVRVFVPNTVTAVDGAFSLEITGNPAVADPIS